MPFLTEELWGHLRRIVPDCSLGGGREKDGALLMLADWPAVPEDFVDEEAERAFEAVREVVTAARRIREKLRVAPREKMPLVVSTETEETATLLRPFAQMIELLAGAAEGVEIGAGLAKPAGASAEDLDGARVFSVVAGDTAAERKRAEKELARAEEAAARASAKLDDSKFTSRAAQEVVEREQVRLRDLGAQIERLKEHIAGL